MKTIPGIYQDLQHGFWSLKKVFNNNIPDLFLKDR
jgi:hypothetical protein